MDGSSFGDNLMRALPDTIGQIIGEALGNELRGLSRRASAEDADRESVGGADSNDNSAIENPSAKNSQTEGERAEIIVTARQRISELRTSLGALGIPEWSKVQPALIEGTPYLDGSETILEPVGDIPGGPTNPNDTLAGAINAYAYFTEDTFDDLGEFLLKNHLVARDGSDIADVVERISWETDGNDMMLSANIAALHAIGKPVFTEIATGLEEVAVERWLDGGMQAEAAANREVENILRVNPLLDDIFFARDVIQGRASRTEIGVMVGAQAVPVVGILGKRLIATESRIARAVRLGREGEAAAGILGPKVGITINGRRRFPDEIAPGIVREVKNVKYQGWTKQLKDYADFAKLEGRSFELWIRPGTKVSRNVLEAEERGDLIIRRMIK